MVELNNISIPGQVPVQAGLLDLNPPDQAQTLLDLTTSTPQVALPTDVVQQRAAKHDFALGDQSPGADHLASLISTNQEDASRVPAVSVDSLKQAASKEAIIHDMIRKGDVSPEDIAAVRAMSQSDLANKDTILERMYAKNLINSALSGVATQTDDPVKQEHIYQMADAAEDAIARKEIAQKKVEELEASETWSNDPSGNLRGLVRSAIPIAPWADVRSMLTDVVPNSIIGPGGTKDMLVQYLMLLPKEQFDTEFPRIIDKVNAEDTWQAQDIAKAVIMRTSAQSSLEGLGEVANAAMLIPYGGLAKFMKGAGGASKVIAGPIAGKASSMINKAVEETVAKSGATQAEKDILSTDVLATRNGNVGEAAARPVANDDLQVVPTPGNQNNPVTLEQSPANLNRNKLYEQGVDGPYVGKNQSGEPSNTNLPAGKNVEQDNIPKSEMPDWQHDDPRAVAQSVLDSTIKANNGTIKNSVENVVAATGNNDLSQTLNVVKRFVARMSEKDPTAQMQDIESRLPSLFSPEKFFSNSFALSREGANRLMDLAEKSNDALAQIFTDTGRVQRLNPQMITTSIENLKSKMGQVYGANLKDGILGGEYIGPEGQWLNRHSVNLRIGKSTTADFFDTAKEAKTWASKHYGLQDDSYKIVQRNGKYEINSIRDLDETGNNIQAFIGKDDTNPSLLGSVIDALRVGSADRLFDAGNNAARKVVTYGTPRVQELIAKAIKPIGKLSKDSVAKLSSFLEENQGVQNGKWFDTAADMEQTWMKRFGDYPNEKEVSAYDAYRRVSDTDWMLRNANKLVSMSRLGVEQVQLKFSLANNGVRKNLMSPYFNGIVKDTLPLESKNEFAFFHFDPDANIAEVKFRSSLTTDERAALAKDIKDGKYKVVQVHDSEQKPLKEFLGDSTPGGKQEVNFVLSKNIQTKRLDVKQVGYSEGGGHLIYKAKAYVKQPTLSWNGNRKVYLGDKTITPHGSLAEARDYAQNMEKARDLYNAGKPAEFDKHVKETLPMDPKDLYGRFHGGSLDAKTPFHAVQEGKSVAETTDLGIHDNMVDSPFRTSRYTTGQFEGEKNALLKGVSEGDGTDASPMFKFSKAKITDPFSALSRGIGDATHSAFYNDYRIKAVQDFVNKFYSAFDSSKVSLDDVQRNPFYYFNNPEKFLRKDISPQTIRARAQMASINALLNKNTVTQDVMRYLNNKMLDGIYKKFGIDGAAAVDEKLLSKITDPFTYLRSVAYHLKMGLFHVPTLFAQLNTIPHSMAISGARDGFRGFADLWLLNAARWTENPDVLARLDSISSKLGSKAGQFSEMRSELMRAGFDVVGSEHAWIDSIRDPKIFRGPVGQFLDKGTMFFREGERQARMSGFAQAFQTWKRVNPGKVIDDNARGWIANRADMLNLQMSRASSATWQKGAMSIPTQFMGYPARLMEQMLPGKTLTKMEKLRLWGYYSTMFGIPAVGTAVAPLHNWAEDIRQKALEQGIDRDDKFYDGLMNGFGEVLANSIFGSDENWSERFGPTSANNELDKWWKGDPTFDPVGLVTGASGSTLSDVLTHSWAAFIRPMYDGSIALKADDFLAVFRDASIGDKSIRAYYGLNFSKWLSKNNVLLDNNVTATEILGNFVLGLTPKGIQNYYDEKNSIQSTEKARQDVNQQASEELRLAAVALSSNTRPSYEEHYKRAMALMEAAGFTPIDKQKLINKSVLDNEDMIDRMNTKWIQKGLPADQANRARTVQQRQQ